MVMKKTAHIIILVLVVNTIQAQDRMVKENNYRDRNEIYTLFGPYSGGGGYGAVTLGFSEIDGRNGIVMGGRGEWIIGHGLGLGVGGYGFLNEPELNGMDNLYYNLAGGYGGLIIEPILFGRWPVHIAFPVLLGAGGIALSSFSEDFFMQFESYEANFEEGSAFLIAEPGVELEFNLVRWMRLSLYGTYRYTTSIISTGTIHENALEGWSSGITLKIGSF